MMDTILPCPFCGKLATVRIAFQSEDSEEPLAHDDYMAYLCDFRNGGCGATSGYRATEEQALTDWNHRRPQPSAPVQPVARDYIAITNKHIDAADEIILYIKDCKSEFIECTPLASILAKRFREGEIV